MKKHQHGFSVVFILIAVVAIGLLGFVGWRVLARSETNGSRETTSSNNSTRSTEKPEAEADIVLQNIGLTGLDETEYTTYATSEFASKGLKGFYVFGDALPGGRVNPNFEFASMKQDTKVVSAIDGIVGFVREQTESNDTEVFIQPKEGSMWTIGYDHLVNVKVKKGDMVKAGDLLGNPARQNNGLYRFEIQINKDENGSTTHLCPSTLLAAGVKDTILAELASSQNKWESISKLELYDTAMQEPVGCLRKTLTPAEAEGKQ